MRVPIMEEYGMRAMAFCGALSFPGRKIGMWRASSPK